MDKLAKLAFVIQQLATYSGQKKAINGGSTFVSCPYHTESTPSFRIFHSPSTKSPGYGKCYGCGAAHPWNEYAAKIGLKPWAYAKPTELFAHTLIEREKEQGEEKLVLSELPKNKVWRGLKTNFLRSIGMQLCTTSWGASFVFLPVDVLGRRRGYVKARLRKVAGEISYINSKGSWSSSSGLFLYDQVMATKPKVLVLVEGPRDALRLLSYGIPAISILGTQSWSPKKSRLIELSGVDYAIICMDGDCAGLRAVTWVSQHLKSFVKTKIFSLTGKDSPYYKFREEDEPTKAAKQAGVELWDPGNMPLRKVEQLKQLVNKLSQTSRQDT